MDIKVSGRKTTVTDALRARVDEKIGEACSVFDISPMTVDVVLRYEKNPANPNPAIVEVTIRARGSVIRVAEHGSDMYAAIDSAADKATRQLRKFSLSKPLFLAQRAELFSEPHSISSYL